MDFELVLSSMLLEPKIAFRIRRDLVTNVLYDGQCRALQSHFNILDCCNFTWVKDCEVCTVLLHKGLFVKNKQHLQQNAPSGPRVRYKIWSIIHQFLRWSEFCSKSTKFDMMHTHCEDRIECLSFDFPFFFS